MGRRLLGGLLLLVAFIVLILGAYSFAQPFLAPDRNLHDGTIYAAGVHHVRTGNAGRVAVPYVKVRLDDGVTHEVEDGRLRRAYLAGGVDEAPVRVQLSTEDGYPKRVRYKDVWYGVGPPSWFWILFGLAFLAAGYFMGRSGWRLVRRSGASAP